MKKNVALIGCGVMGSAIATRLLEKDFSLVVFDVDAEKANSLGLRGATTAASAADAAAAATTVILSLNNAAIVREVVFGPAGHRRRSCQRLGHHRHVVNRPHRDEGALCRRGGSWAQMGRCALIGWCSQGAHGQIGCDGWRDQRDFAEARLTLDYLCENLTLMGPSGAGQTTKLINQVLCALHFVAVAEATKLAVDAGVDAQRIPSALSGGRADSAILQEFMGKMARNDYSPTGRIDNMVKDLDAVQSLARHTGTGMPMTSLCMEIHRLLVSAGHGAADNAAIMRFYDGPRA